MTPTYSKEELQMQYEYLIGAMKKAASKYSETILVCPPGHPGSDYSSGIPYGVEKARADKWEHANWVYEISSDGIVTKKEDQNATQ